MFKKPITKKIQTTLENFTKKFKKRLKINFKLIVRNDKIKNTLKHIKHLTSTKNTVR